MNFIRAEANDQGGYILVNLDHVEIITKDNSVASGGDVNHYALKDLGGDTIGWINEEQAILLGGS